MNNDGKRQCIRGIGGKVVFLILDNNGMVSNNRMVSAETIETLPMLFIPIAILLLACCRYCFVSQSPQELL